MLEGQNCGNGSLVMMILEAMRDGAEDMQATYSEIREAGTCSAVGQSPTRLMSEPQPILSPYDGVSPIRSNQIRSDCYKSGKYSH